ncbi:MAG: ATP-binding cassette domain-containing protein [Chromatiales bacterium]|nr:ATP-binding cassette domain-containing protein [Chromatiales bacterium]
MIYAVIQTIQLLGRRVLIKISWLAGGLIFSGLFQILPLILILPMIRIIARPSKQVQGVPRAMRRLLPEDTVNTLDQLIVSTDTKTLIISVVAIAVSLFGIQALITGYTKRYLANFLIQQQYILANKLFNNYVQKDVFSYSNPLKAIDLGCSALAKILGGTIESLFNIVMFSMLAFILIFIYPLPGSATVSVTILATLSMAFIIQPRMNRVLLELRLSVGQAGRALAENMKAIKEIKLMGRERHFLNNYLEGQVNKQAQEKLKERYNTIMNVISIIIKYAGLAAGMVLAIYTLPKEALSGFAMIFIMLSMRMVAYANATIVKTKTVYESSAELGLYYNTMLKYDTEQTTASRSEIVLNESIKFEDIYFRHTDDKFDEDEEDYEAIALLQKEEKKEEEKLPFILEGLDFQIKKGQFVGLIGRNGSGKSTILDLLSGLFVPTEGRILIDGKQLQVSDRKHWRKQISYVIQNPYMVSNTIFYNVTLGLPEEEVDKQLLERALELSMLDQIVKQLPKGMDTQVGVTGTKISGGQAQRIALARAFYQNRPLLLLDEATRAIDSATEVEIMNKISSMRGDKTLIAVTHRVQSLRQCDIIFVVDNKKITAAGDYETLCKNNQLFRLFALGMESKKKKREVKIPSVA